MTTQTENTLSMIDAFDGGTVPSLIATVDLSNYTITFTDKDIKIMNITVGYLIYRSGLININGLNHIWDIVIDKGTPTVTVRPIVYPNGELSLGDIIKCEVVTRS